MILAGFLFTIAYIVFTGTLIYFWHSIPSGLSQVSLQQTFISVIIPVRNEADKILKLLQDLDCQSYPASQFEVIVVNDASTDNTADLVNSYRASYSLLLLHLKEEDSLAPKKKALTLGISHARGSLIMTTDGDCSVSKGWVSTIENFYILTKSRFITGGVTFHNEKNIFQKIQTIEFASLTGSGAACLKAGFPNMCNGANLCYEKKVFEEVHGYAGNEKVASGDDEFLMHKVFDKYPDGVSFIKEKESIVTTSAKEKLLDFYYQRKRWAGKWNYYQFNNIKIIAIFIFLSNFSLLVFLILSFIKAYPLSILLLQYLTKFILDYLFIKSILKFYNKKMNVLTYVITSLLYPFYVSFFGLAGKIGSYSWKGRKLL